MYAARALPDWTSFEVISSLHHEHFSCRSELENRLCSHVFLLQVARGASEAPPGRSMGRIEITPEIGKLTDVLRKLWRRLWAFEGSRMARLRRVGPVLVLVNGR